MPLLTKILVLRVQQLSSNDLRLKLVPGGRSAALKFEVAESASAERRLPSLGTVMRRI